MRYWRPAPPAPVARTGEAAAKKPLGHARTPEEARTLLSAPAELAQEMLPNLYVDHKQLMKRWGEWVRTGLGEIVETRKQVRGAHHVLASDACAGDRRAARAGRTHRAGRARGGAAA